MTEYIELHPTKDSNIFKGGAPIVRDDDEEPQFPGRMKALLTTGRTDGPWAGRLYDEKADTWADPPPVPPRSPSRAEELKALATWTATDRNEALEIFLRSNI